MWYLSMQIMMSMAEDKQQPKALTIISTLQEMLSASHLKYHKCVQQYETHFRVKNSHCDKLKLIYAKTSLHNIYNMKEKKKKTQCGFKLSVVNDCPRTRLFGVIRPHILIHSSPDIEYCAGAQSQLAKDLSQIVEAYVKIIKLKVWKPIY